MNEQENGTSQDLEDGIVPPAASDDEASPVGDDGIPAAADTSPPAWVEAEISAMRERYMRLAAEFDNYKKRVDRERGEIAVRAQVHLLERMLEPLDDLHRIAEQEASVASASALQEGAGMVQKKFMRVLEALGVEEIDAEGRAFDPTIHEALTTIPADSAEDDEIVAQVYQKGYLLKGALVRAARVVVRKYAG
jgi:molecular chaperone GrpE